MNVLAIIPARGGSKGVPRKNIKFLDGMPLISYSIKSAYKSKCVLKIAVSSEDNEILKTANEYPVISIKRPESLAMDDSATIDTIIHALDFLENKGYVPNIIILLQPTSPLRTSLDIDCSLNIFLKNKCDSVISVCEFSHSPYWGLKMKGEYLKPVFGNKYLKKRRQDLPTIYLPNGAIFISTPQYLKKHRTFYSEKTIPYIMPAERSIDIDTELDFKLAELILKEQYHDKSNSNSK